MAKPFVAKNGIVVSMMGAKAEKELSNIEIWLQNHEYMIQKMVSCELPFGKEQRSLLVFSQG